MNLSQAQVRDVLTVLWEVCCEGRVAPEPDELLSHRFPMVLLPDEKRRKLLAQYLLVYAWKNQGSRAAAVSPTYRQSKLIFEELVRLWEALPAGIRHLVEGPRRDVDRCHFTMGDSSVVFLPVSEERVCGMRPDILVADECYGMPEEHLLAFASAGCRQVVLASHPHQWENHFTKTIAEYRRLAETNTDYYVIEEIQ